VDPSLPNGQDPRDGRPDLAVVTESSLMPVPAAAAEPAAPAAGSAVTDLAEAARSGRQISRMVRWLTQTKIVPWRRKRHTRRAVRALEAEQRLIGAPRDGSAPTHGETVVRGIARRSADRVLGRVHRLHRLTSRTDGLKARRAALRGLITLVPGEHVKYPGGGWRTLTEIVCERDALHATVIKDRSSGSRKHDRLPRWFRRLPWLVLVFDFLLLSYFFAGVTNVNWSNPLSEPLAFAAGLAAMITVVSFGCFAFAGHRLRDHKDHSRAIPLDNLDPLSWLICAACALSVVILAVLMFVRMHAEVLLALGPGASGAAIVIAAALAAVSVSANILVISVHAMDGSQETDRLDALGAAASRPQVRADRMRRRATQLGPVIARRARQAERIAARARSRAERPMANAEEIIGLARVRHQGAGSLSEAAADPGREPGAAGYRRPDAGAQPDERPLRLALEHMATDVPSATDQAEAPR
jgi:hypothetical protein